MSLDTRPRADLVADALGRVDALRVFGFVFFVIATLAIWTQIQPFQSLQDYGILDDPAQSNDLRRFITLGMAGLAALLVWSRGGLPVLVRSVTISLILVFAWFLVTSMMSPYRGTALNRLALAGVSIFIAMCMPLLFGRVDDFIKAMGVTASIAIVLSFLGVIFAPELAIHTVKDNTAQSLAGNWRGLFAHKNELAAMATEFILVGVLLYRTSSRVWGATMTIASLALLVASGGKTALLLLVPLFLFGAIISRLRSLGGTIAVAILCVGGTLLLTVGSLGVPAIKTLLETTMPDPSFTGRTEIWGLAVEAIGVKPITGFGYNTFWDTAQTYSVATEDSNAAALPNAHNGFLDTAISAGLPGLALVLAWFGIGPLRNLNKVRRQPLNQRDRAFLEFLVQTWLFTFLISVLESVLFNRGGSVWFQGLVAMACLQQWAMSRKAPL